MFTNWAQLFAPVGFAHDFCTLTDDVEVFHKVSAFYSPVHDRGLALAYTIGAEFDAAGRAVSLEEMPAKPKSPWAVTGLYFYDSQAPRLAAGLKKSARDEYEITDLNQAYLEELRQGQSVACLEEIAFQQGWIGVEDVRRAAAQLCKNGYGAYLAALAEEHATGA